METDFWRRSVGKSRLEKVHNETIKETMNVKKNTIQMIEDKQHGWFGHIIRMGHKGLPSLVLEWEPECRRRRGRPRKI